MHVIRAASYGVNEAALAADPIITDMAIDITRMVANGREVNTFDHTFMMASLREYKARGGTLTEHIGGPAAAIRTVMCKTADDLDRYVVWHCDPETVGQVPMSGTEVAELTDRAARIRRAATVDPRGEQ